MNSKSAENTATRNPRHRDPNVLPGRSILRPKSVGRSRSETSNHHKPSRPRSSATALASGSPKEQRSPNTQSVSIELPSNIRQINSGSPGSGPLFQIQLPPDADVEDLERLVAGLASKSLGKKPSRGEGVPRPLGKREDDPEILTHQMDKWAAGDYGPVLDSFTVSLKRIPLVINPCLRPPSSSEEGQVLHWNMVYYPGPNVLQSSALITRQPATLPRLSSIGIMTRSLPWTIRVPTKDSSIGVTCGDVIKTLHAVLQMCPQPSDISKISAERMLEIQKAGLARDALVPDRLNVLRWLDCLVGKTMFGGLIDLTEHPDHIDEVGSFLPATMILFCRQPDNPTTD